MMGKNNTRLDFGIRYTTYLRRSNRSLVEKETIKKMKIVNTQKSDGKKKFRKYMR